MSPSGYLTTQFDGIRRVVQAFLSDQPWWVLFGDRAVPPDSGSLGMVPLLIGSGLVYSLPDGLSCDSVRDC